MVKDEVECAATDEDTAARMQHEQWAKAVEMRIARSRGEEFHTRWPWDDDRTSSGSDGVDGGITFLTSRCLM